jgi:hypothetical protein
VELVGPNETWSREDLEALRGTDELEREVGLLGGGLQDEAATRQQPVPLAQT